MKRIIIHYPFKIDRNRKSASQIRPIKILDTFRNLGYEVDLIEGYGKDRTAQIKKIKQNIRDGVKYDFVYSESSTNPTQLTEKNHFPLYPFLDFGFFSFCKENNIPIGLFYRDIYWCFSENINNMKMRVARLFHRYDIRKYNELLTHLFVPSREMIKHVPVPVTIPITELYSGCIPIANMPVYNSKSNKLNVLYVGGIGHHYDLSMFMKVVQQCPDVEFTLCCRLDDWEQVKHEYEMFLSNGNIHVVHKSGDELKQLYSNADLFCLFVEPDKYREFAVPFKLFETVGYACPIIASEGTWVARYVRENGIGMISKFDAESLKTNIQELINDREMLKKYKMRIKEIIPDNTWEARCKTIDRILRNN